MKIKSYQCKLKMKIKNVTLFTHEIQHMVCSNMSELERREKLHTCSTKRDPGECEQDYELLHLWRGYHP